MGRTDHPANCGRLASPFGLGSALKRAVHGSFHLRWRPLGHDDCFRLLSTGGMARDTLTDWQGSARGQGGGVQSALEGRARLLAANVNEGVWLVTAGTGLRLAVGGWRSIVYVWVWIAEMPPASP